MLQHLQSRQNPLRHAVIIIYRVTQAMHVSSADLGQLGSAFLDAVLDPGHHGVKNLLLTPDVELVTGNDVNQLIGRQQHEFLAFHDL